MFVGCGGNDNNFASLTDCENKCSHHLSKERSLKPEKSKFRSKTLPTNPLCLLPVEVGPCEALIPGFFFNTQTKRCEAFVYGGCRGNGNRFSTRDECESTCALPSQSGGENKIKLFFYIFVMSVNVVEKAVFDKRIMKISVNP